jgi:coenzyme F420-reducing hydrogenase beta subunit
MRCSCCNALLSDYEATMKNEHGKYLDTCMDCLEVIAEDVPIMYTGNPALLLQDNNTEDDTD